MPPTTGQKNAKNDKTEKSKPGKNLATTKSAQNGTGKDKNKTSAAKTANKKAVENAKGANDDFLSMLNEESQDQEDQWLNQVNQLIQKKKTIDTSDKFTPNLYRLYNELQHELSLRCKVTCTPVFQEPDAHYNWAQAAKLTSSVEQLDKTLLEKLAESAAKINELNEVHKKLNTELDSSQNELKKLKIANTSKTDENAKLREELDNLKKKQQEYENKIKMPATCTNSANDNSTDLKHKLIDQQEHLKEKHEKIQQLETSKLSLLKEMVDLKNRIKECDNELTTIKNDLEAKLDKEIEKRRNLESQNEELRQDLMKTKRDQMESTNKNEGTTNSQITRLTGENERLKDNGKKLEETISKMKENETKLQNEIKVLTEKNNGLEDIADKIKKQVRQEIDHHTKKTETLSKDIMSREHEILDLKRSKSEIERGQSSMQKQIDEQAALIKRLEEEKNKLKKEKKTSTKGPDQKLIDLQEENDKLRDRLSQIAGSKLTDGNPAIADLGDPNRPTQLGEKFSELYDNEWTDAMEELGNAGDEKTNITTLRNIVEKSYEFGKTSAADYVKGLEEALLKINKSIQVTPDIAKLIKEHRKNIALVVADSLHHTFLSSYTEYNVGGEGVKKFIRKTVTLCWLMAIQDPPVILTTKMSGKFDTDRFRHYTKSGSTVDYVVWPVVFLHEGGPIICKGVAQGK